MIGLLSNSTQSLFFSTATSSLGITPLCYLKITLYRRYVPFILEHLSLRNHLKRNTCQCHTWYRDRRTIYAITKPISYFKECRRNDYIIIVLGRIDTCSYQQNCVCFVTSASLIKVCNKQVNHILLFFAILFLP